MSCTACGISSEAARAISYRDQLLRSVLLSPVEFFDVIVPLYNDLNGTYLIGSLEVDYTATLCGLADSDDGQGGWS